MKKPTIAMSEFAAGRHTPESKYSHFEGSNEELIELVAANLDRAKQGYREGVLEVPVPAERFRSGVVEVTPDTQLRTTFESRREGEAPFLQTVALGAEKLPAKAVSIILYSHEALAENNEASSDADWEIISVNARPTLEEEPLSPMAMARNFLQLAGGTKAEYTAEDFAKSIIYWSTRVMSGGSN